MTGVELIAAERERQQRVEGWTPEHDVQHSSGELLRASLCYVNLSLRDHEANRLYGSRPIGWPWGMEWWKPSDDPVRNLVKAGALIAAEIDRIQREKEAERIKSIPPPDRDARVLVDGSPVTDDHRELLPSGQQKGYVVLSSEERSRGFVRPLRRSYRHLACGGVTTMAQAIAETYARDPGFYSGTFCSTCSSHFPIETFGQVGQFVWLDDGSKVGS